MKMIKKKILTEIESRCVKSHKMLAVLIYRDDLDETGLVQCLNRCMENTVDFILVGGSLVTSNNMHEVVNFIKSYRASHVFFFLETPFRFRQKQMLFYFYH